MSYYCAVTEYHVPWPSFSYWAEITKLSAREQVLSAFSRIRTSICIFVILYIRRIGKYKYERANTRPQMKPQSLHWKCKFSVLAVRMNSFRAFGSNVSRCLCFLDLICASLRERKLIIHISGEKPYAPLISSVPTLEC